MRKTPRVNEIQETEEASENENENESPLESDSDETFDIEALKRILKISKGKARPRSNADKPVQRRSTTRQPAPTVSTDTTVALNSFCIKCKTPGHEHTACPDTSNRVYCFRCGLEGYTSKACPNPICRTVTKN